MSTSSYIYRIPAPVDAQQSSWEETINLQRQNYGVIARHGYAWARYQKASRNWEEP